MSIKVISMASLAMFLFMCIVGIFFIKPFSKDAKGKDVLPDEVIHNKVSVSNQGETVGYKEHSAAENKEGTKNLLSVESNGLTFELESIGVNEAVCIGKIEIREGSVFTIRAAAETGQKIFVALNETDNINSYLGVEWKQFCGIIGNEIRYQFTDINTGTFYVYVGNYGKEPIMNVKGILTECKEDKPDKGYWLDKKDILDKVDDFDKKDKEEILPLPMKTYPLMLKLLEQMKSYVSGR